MIRTYILFLPHTTLSPTIQHGPGDVLHGGQGGGGGKGGEGEGAGEGEGGGEGDDLRQSHGRGDQAARWGSESCGSKEERVVWKLSGFKVKISSTFISMKITQKSM